MWFFFSGFLVFDIIFKYEICMNILFVFMVINILLVIRVLFDLFSFLVIDI